MEITAITEGCNYIIQIEGDVDASSSIYVDQQIRDAIDRGETSHVLIDCQNLKYISSAGLGVFMSYIAELNEKSMKMTLFGLNEKVAHVFQILGLDNLMSIVKDKEEALARK